jgi:RNA polymerase sigma-70 factor, ECF subfamily
VDQAAVYDEHAQALFAFLLNFTRDETDTRDILQEVFLKIARRPELLDRVRDRRGFLLRMSHNLAIDFMRRRTTRERISDCATSENPDLFASSSDPDEALYRQALSQSMADLPPDQRAIVHLRLWEGRTFVEISDILEIPLNTAASRYRYGIDKLRALLRPLYDELK